MKRTMIVAGGLAAALIAAGAAEAHGPGGWGGGRGAGPAAIDFDAVAGGADAIARDAMVDWGAERLAAFDLDGDGMLDRHELAAAMPAREPHPFAVFAPDRTGMHVDRLLARFEAEEAGAVSVEAVARRQVDAIFARLDRDGDGTITRKEAERALERRAMRGERGRR